MRTIEAVRNAIYVFDSAYEYNGETYDIRYEIPMSDDCVTVAGATMIYSSALDHPYPTNEMLEAMRVELDAELLAPLTDGRYFHELRDMTIQYHEDVVAMDEAELRHAKATVRQIESYIEEGKRNVAQAYALPTSYEDALKGCISQRGAS